MSSSLSKALNSEMGYSLIATIGGNHKIVTDAKLTMTPPEPSPSCLLDLKNRSSSSFIDVISPESDSTERSEMDLTLGGDFKGAGFKSKDPSTSCSEPKQKYLLMLCNIGIDSKHWNRSAADNIFIVLSLQTLTVRRSGLIPPIVRTQKYSTLQNQC